MRKLILFLMALTLTLTSCSEEEDDGLLQRSDVIILMPEGGWKAEIGQPFHINVKCKKEEGIVFRWFISDTFIMERKDLDYVFFRTGFQFLKLIAIQGNRYFDYTVLIDVKGKSNPNGGNESPYITKVLDYVPAPGQFTNKYPVYSFGNTQQDMNNKVLSAIGNNNMGVVTLGGYGGYVVVGFDHTIKNKKGKFDFRVLGNVHNTYEDSSSGEINEGGAEPGIIMVAYDANHNNRPDYNEWYEIAGSAHINPEGEPWYTNARVHGNNMNLYKDYTITYYAPEREPEFEGEWGKYIKWKDNQGHSGYIKKNAFNTQKYYPEWIYKDELKFTGTCLPQNAINQGGGIFYNYSYKYGYADNAKNNTRAANIDIDWAVRADGRKANLPGVDFIKIYTGVNQRYGSVGECSTEISGIEDLHVLNENINSNIY